MGLAHPPELDDPVPPVAVVEMFERNQAPLLAPREQYRQAHVFLAGPQLLPHAILRRLDGPADLALVHGREAIPPPRRGETERPSNLAVAGPTGLEVRRREPPYASDRSYASEDPASSTAGVSGESGASNVISPSWTSTITVCPARNSRYSNFSDSGSSTIRWIVRRSGRAPSAGS